MSHKIATSLAGQFKIFCHATSRSKMHRTAINHHSTGVTAWLTLPFMAAITAMHSKTNSTVATLKSLRADSRQTGVEASFGR